MDSEIIPLAVVEPELHLSLESIFSTLPKPENPEEPDAAHDERFSLCCTNGLTWIEDERLAQGRRPMSNDERIIFVHEAYRTYIEHKDRKRKNGDWYYDEHLWGAVIMAVQKEGMVGLSTLLATLKHDNVEDLVNEGNIGRVVAEVKRKFDQDGVDDPNGVKRNKLIKETETKASRDEEKRLLAELIDSKDYADYLKGRDIAENIEVLRVTVQTLVKGVTKFQKAQREDTEEATFKRLLQGALEAIRTIYIKLADRAHNVLTISGHRPEAQKRIMKETEIQYLALARILKIRKMVEFLVDQLCGFFNPNFLKEFNDFEADRREWLPDSQKSEIEEFFTDPSLGEGLCEVKSAKFVATSLSHYVALVDADFADMKMADLPIGPFDPMEEILITIDLKDPKSRSAALDQVATAIQQRFASSDKSKVERVIAPKDDPDNILGMQLICYNPEFGKEPELGHFCFRINDRVSEAKSKRGVLAEAATAETPKDVQAMIQAIFNKAANFHGKKGVKELAKAELLKPRISVTTPEGDVYTLPQGSTALDFAASLHEDLLVNMQGVSVLPSLTSKQPATKVDPLDALQDGKVYIIDLDSDKANSRVKPEFLFFVNSIGAGAIRSHLAKTAAENPNRGVEYLERLSALFNVKITEMMPLLRKKYSAKSVDQILREIGGGTINPVFVLAQCIDSKNDNYKRDLGESGLADRDLKKNISGISKWEVRIDLSEEAASLSKFSEEFSAQVGIKIDRIKSHIPGRAGKLGRLNLIFDLEDTNISVYNFFIKLIKLKEKYKVALVSPMSERIYRRNRPNN